MSIEGSKKGYEASPPAEGCPQDGVGNKKLKTTGNEIVTHINSIPIYRNFSGYLPKELNDFNVLCFFPEQERPRIADAIRLVIREGNASIESVALRKDGTQYPIQIHGVSEIAGGKVYITGVGLSLIHI